MRALIAALGAVLLVAAGAASAQSAERSRPTYYTFTCQGSNTMLRVIFNEERNTATVHRIRRPSIRLTRAEGEGENFRYVRGDDYELSGNLSQVQFRVGRAVWECPAGA